MSYYGGKEIAEAFRGVRKHTVTIAEEIPEDRYGHSPSPDTMSVGALLTHIALSPGFALMIHGDKIVDMKTVNFAELMQRIGVEQAKPRTKAEIIAFLKSEGEKFASFVEDLPDSFLAERVEMPGGEPATKSRFEMLLSTKEHEMHHRGQLMLIQRMIGLVPHLTRQRQEQRAHAASRG